MALSIKHPEADRLARELAAETGEGLTEAVLAALRERLGRVKKRSKLSLVDELGGIARRISAMPTLDTRSAEDILGYDSDGLPH
jgi:antitoxin VapB